MNYFWHYETIFGQITLFADENFLQQILFEKKIFKNALNLENSIIKTTKKWLEIYVSGKNPNFTPPLKPKGSEFQLKTWELLQQIPYGKTTTYGKIAEILAKQKGIKKMSAQAVGGAVSKNEIPIIIPCHRVIGINQNLVGYTGGLDKKIKLLSLEGHNLKNFVFPKNYNGIMDKFRFLYNSK